MTARITFPQATRPQKDQLNRLIEEVVTELDLTKHGMQRILEKGGVLKERISSILKELSAQTPPAMIHAAKYIPEGWKVVEGEDAPPTLTSVEDVEPIDFLYEHDAVDGVDGETMLKRIPFTFGCLKHSFLSYILLKYDSLTS